MTTHPEARCLHLRESDRAFWAQQISHYTEGSFQSVVADVSCLTEKEVMDLYRILKPGGHLCLMGDESSAGMCEDFGFELRDTIYLAQTKSSIFYCPKASKREKNEGLDDFDPCQVNDGRSTSIDNPYQRGDTLRKNTHPTVKPIKVLEWLLAEFGPEDLDTPPTILDPFMGSGTAGIVSKKKSCSYIGMEINPEYFEISKARIGEYDKAELLCGDCTELMQGLPDDCVDLVLCDPPYGLRFMAKGWDNLGVGLQQEAWHIRWLEQAYRVLNPGGYIVAFGGTRTFHRLLRAMQGVGLRCEPTRAWVYGSGFPKSHNIALGIDKKFGASNRGGAISSGSKYHPTTGEARPSGKQLPKYESRTHESQGWDGWGSALKPGWEAICIGRKL